MVPEGLGAAALWQRLSALVSGDRRDNSCSRKTKHLASWWEKSKPSAEGCWWFFCRRRRRAQTTRRTAPQMMGESSWLSFGVLLNILAMIKDGTLDGKALGIVPECCCILHAWHQSLQKTNFNTICLLSRRCTAAHFPVESH